MKDGKTIARLRFGLKAIFSSSDQRTSDPPANRSGSVFQYTATPGQFAYVPGFRPGTDIYRIFFTNGCGPMYAEFTATVQ